MNRTLRFAKRFALPALAAGVLLVLAQVVFAQPPVVPAFTVTPPAAGNNCGGTWTFTSNATDPDEDITSTDWNFGDGTTGNGTPVQHTYALPGTYTVQESVTDAAGGDDLTVDTVNAPNQNVVVGNSGQPTADVNATPNPAQPNATITLSAAGSADPGAGGGITQYEWDLNNDGTFETNSGATATTTTSFAGAGIHTVRVRVTDNCGATAQDRTDVFVNNTPPTASFTSTPTPGKVGVAMTFNASASTDAGGSIASYHWVWGDGTADTVTAAATTTHIFATSGQHFVQLTVTDNDAATNSTSRQVRVNARPTANFVAAANPSLIGEQVTFTPTGSTDGDGTIASYQWDFDGDGIVDATSLPAAPAVTHTYGTPGDVNVKLIVTDNDGDTGEITRVQT